MARPPRDGFGVPADWDRGAERVLYGGPPKWARDEWEKKAKLEKLARDLARNGPCLTPGCHICDGSLAARYERREPG